MSARHRVVPRGIDRRRWLLPLGPILFGAVALWSGPTTSMSAMATVLLVGGAIIYSSRPVREMR